MKILNAMQIHQADVFTINSKPISSINLMERAAMACIERIIKLAGARKVIKIFCGLGNNGGDGLAIARLLYKMNFSIEVFILRNAGKCSEDFKINEQRLIELKNVPIHNLDLTNSLPAIQFESSNSLIIDSIFGSGLNRPIEGFVAELVQQINQSGAPVISIDIPSGLFSDDNSNNKTENIVKAKYTLTFQAPKLAFMFPENDDFIGEFMVLDIGINKQFISEIPSKDFFVTKEFVKRIIKPRKKSSHKGMFGHALIIAGSYGKMGAAVLASKACLRAGAGRLTSNIPHCGYEILQSCIPEAMLSVDAAENFLSEAVSLYQFDVIGIGPGLGMEQETKNVLKLLIQNSSKPMVLDADAINIISENKTWISFLPKESIFTPHPKEFERLVGKSANSFERYQMQRDFAIKNGVYLILKHPHTSIACPNGNVFFNSTGNPGMATAGSGDVLTGIITGLLAQGYNSEEVSIMGVYLHGLAGDIAAMEISEQALIASDIIDYLGKAFLYLNHYEGPINS